jgi:D-2-hydroxyacid dehydrogenase (NADP+)
MKIVLHTPVGRQLDYTPLQNRFPDHPIVRTKDIDSLAREIRDAEVLIASNRPYLPDMVAAINDNQTRLKWIQFTTSGIDKALRSGGFPKGVVVTNSAGLGAPILAEHAFYMFMALGRRMRDTEAAVREHYWDRDVIANKTTAMTFATLCIIGMGATGQEMARRAKAFDMKVIGVSRDYKPNDMVDEVFDREHVDDALAQADFVLLSMPAVAETRDFINADRLKAMKKGAFLVNVARGDLIDEDALIKACTEGRIGGAGLDVTKIEPTPADSPLWDVPNIIVTPHIAGAGADNAPRLFQIIGENLKAYLDGKPLNRVLDWENMMPD